MSNVGMPFNFDPELFCNVVEHLIMSDEVENAFRMLNEIVPSYYRDHPTERMKEIRNSLHRQLFTPAQYAAADLEAERCNPKELAEYWPLRAEVLSETIKELNGRGINPNIMEVAPGSFWLPYALKEREFKFTYEYQSLLRRKDNPFDLPPNNPETNIFVAFEFIEHLSNEWELYQAYLKFKHQAKYIFISTPKYTYGGGMIFWRTNALGHLRTYTPKEFYKIVSTMFDGYQWEMFSDDTMILRGVLNDGDKT